MTNYTNLNIERLIDFCAGYLCVSGANLIVMHNDKLLDKFSTPDIELQALLHKNPLPHSYNLIIRENAGDINSIICHEMIHLSQYEAGDLDLNMKERTFYWKGKTYAGTTPYFSRPWEKAAFRQQNKLLKAFRLSAKKSPLPKKEL